MASLPSVRLSELFSSGSERPHAHAWRRALLAKIPFGLAFAALWALSYVPAEFSSGRRGLALVFSTFFMPVLTMSTLIVLTTWVDLRWRHHRRKFLLLTAAAPVAALTAGIVDLSLVFGSGIWSYPPRYSVFVIMWGNLGYAIAMSLVATYAFDSLTRARQRAEALANVRRERALTLRRTVEARLQATQARVDPQFLFEALAAVETVRAASSADGDRLLDDLIAYLRAALPDVQAVSTTLGSEVALARAWLDIQSMLRDGRLQSKVDVPGTLLGMRLPRMILVPLLEVALVSTDPAVPMSIALEARSVDTGLRVRVLSGAPVASEGRRIDELRVRLEELYGQTARVVVANGAAHTGEMILELPNDAEGDTR